MTQQDRIVHIRFGVCNGFTPGKTNGLPAGTCVAVWPPHELYVRLLVLTCFAAFGLIISVAVVRRERAERERAALARFPSENPNPMLRLSADGTVLYGNEASSIVLAAWGCDGRESLGEEWLGVISDVIRTGRPREEELECANRVLSLTFAPIPEER